jgi:DNA gyrase subunit A
MIINKSGITIRLRVDELRVVGRATQGVKLINLRGNDEIAAVCSVIKDEEVPENAEQSTEDPTDLDQTSSTESSEE